MPDIRVFTGGLTLLRAAADYIVDAAETAMTTNGHFTIALSGGATPKPIYELLATDEYTRYIDWSFGRVFWGDERCVQPDHYDSNYRMAKESLLENVRIPMGNIYRIKGELPPEAAAEDYEKALRGYFLRGTRPLNERQPRFDLILAGIGDDGHTASLFPYTTALEEQARWVAANYVEKLDTWRITLTPPAINAATNILFVVTGEKKADALAQILEGEYDPAQFPAQLVNPESGRVTWMVDVPAASKLSRSTRPVTGMLRALPDENSNE